jgi:2-polyprenyl-6-methoxyphenol hydroxylase-like FAD-dependent oxidoreductase
LSIHRVQLQNLLLEASKEAGVVIEIDARVVQINENGDSPVAITKDGRRREADLIIGADGQSFNTNSRLKSKANKW